MTENNIENANVEQLVEEIQSFIEGKKAKKEPSKADGREFKKLWMKLVEQTGVDDVAITILCDGFRFCAAKPLYGYCKKIAPSRIPYDTLASYSAIRSNNSEIALRMYLSLFGFEVTDPTGAEQIAWLMKQIPDAALNKEGKISGNMNGFVRKLVVEEISGKTIGATSENESLSANEAARFSKLFVPILKTICAKSKLKISDRNAADGLLTWISESCGQDASQAFSQQANAVAAESEIDGGADSFDDTSVVPDERRSSEGVDASIVIDFIRRQEAQLKALASSNASATAEASRLKGERESLREQNASLESRVEKAHETIASQNSRITELEEQLKKTVDDLSANRELVEVLGQDNAKQNDEAMRRVARKLRVEYQDYQDAVDMDMSIDLGENMRLQLGEVFRILKESGFEL